LNEFVDDEIETVLAYELGYHVNWNIPICILVESVLILRG
jgi:hypothetical protein